MPSGSPSVEVGSDHQRPLKLLSRFFWARTEYSSTSTFALMPTSRHMPWIASDIGLSLAVADGRLDDDLLAPVAPLPEPLARLAGVVDEGPELPVEVVVALRDRPVRDDAAPPPELFHDRLAVDGERQRLLHERVVQRRARPA